MLINSIFLLLDINRFSLYVCAGIWNSLTVMLSDGLVQPWNTYSNITLNPIFWFFLIPFSDTFFYIPPHFYPPFLSLFFLTSQSKGNILLHHAISKFIWSIIKIQNKTIYCYYSVVVYIHTGLCSKGTSISNPGSQLPPEDPLVSPFISPFMALTLMETRWENFEALGFWMMNEPWLLPGLVCLAVGIREQWKFSLIICLLNFNNKHITKPKKQGCFQFFTWRRKRRKMRKELILCTLIKTNYS